MEQGYSFSKTPQTKKCMQQKILPLVLCPFGCLEFSSETGRVFLDIAYQRYLLQTRLKIMNKCQAFKYVKWVRDDYIRLPWEYDC